MQRGVAMKPGWEMKTLGDLYNITSSKRVFEADWRKSGVPFYRAREIVKLAKQGFVDNELFISELDF
jgi:type I restriction enzyme, S subunit